jgi:hypothetical protein
MSKSQDAALSLFLSFAPIDSPLTDLLMKHLSTLHRFGDVSPWSADQLRPGDNRETGMTNALDVADAALVLLSADWLSSEIIQTMEVPHLLRRRAELGLRIIPVLLRTCAWEMHPLVRDLTTLPRDGKAIAAYQDDARDQVLTHIVKEVAMIAAGRGRQSPERPVKNSPTAAAVSSARDTISTARQDGPTDIFVVFDHPDAIQRKLFYHAAGFGSFGHFTNELYFELKRVAFGIEPFHYGTQWILRDRATGRIFESLRMLHGVPPGDVYTDNRTLRQVGVEAGMTLEVVPVTKRTLTSAPRGIR